MATNFIEIYDSAINEIDDPNITNAYKSSAISFFKIMYNYLNNAIPLFNNPLSMYSKLIDISVPQGETEIFVGDGITQIFNISSTPLSDSIFEYKINDLTLEGTYNSIDNTIKFSEPIPLDSEGTFDWYYTGQFNTDIDIRAKRILSKLLVVCWAEKEKNFLLDIRRLLNDTDFKLHDASASTKAKVGWYGDMREESEKLMNAYAWELFISQRNT